MIDAHIVERHGLKPDEYERIKEFLGREPNLTELGIFSVMWSEHCSYKSSRVHLKTLPTRGPQVLQGPGENAGAVDIGEGLAAVFKIESHNHPSFIEPYQGAATGVGGIIRDIFTMGARPIALLNSLRFGSIDAPGTRRLLHFGIQLPNTGTADLHIGVPSPDNDNFEWSDCHGHYHFSAYGQYRLLTLDGCEAARGHKNGFCVLDLAPYTPGAGPGQYGCGDMGISVGWSDIYGVGTGCQWVDITDVPAGDYLLEAIVNPEWALAESNYDNNVVLVPVTIDDPGPPPGPEDIVGPCTTPQAGLSRDCGWTVDGVYPCTAGAPVSVGCNDACMTPLGACTGDAMLRACIGPDNVCPSATALASSDDACGTYCPYLTTTCPATGTITVLSAPYASGTAYTCAVVVQ